MKKFLSLVLALVMTMSLVTISAGATEYKDLTDKDEIQYEEAVAVLNRIGVITGYDDGSFRPETELTRGAAAKIIVSLLIGPEAASNLPNTYAPYPDVPAGHTFAGVISYCKTKGIISGYGDGTFKPANALTGYAFAKMLLGAVGYDANLERFVDTGWTMNVAAVGQSAGLFDRLQFDGSKAVTREEACQLALNALKATVVQYSQGLNVNVTGDNTNVVVSGGQTRSYKTSNQQFARNIRTRQGSNIYGNLMNNIATDYYTVEFAEEHFIDLRLEHDQWSPTPDEFGRPSNEWSYKKVTIGTYALEPDFSYTTQVAHADPAKKIDDDTARVTKLGLRGYELKRSDANNESKDYADLWLNGVPTYDWGQNHDVADIAQYTDNGAQVYVYVSNNDADFITDVVVIQTQLMEVKRVGSDYVSLETQDPDQPGSNTDDNPGGPGHAFNYNAIDKDVKDVKEDNENYAILKELKDGDLVAVVPVADDHSATADMLVSKAYVPETVTGALTRTDMYDNEVTDITVGGTNYKVAQWNDKMKDVDATIIKVTRKDVTLYLDEFGNALLADEPGSTSDYMVIGNYYQSLEGGKLVTYVHGWDVGGEELDLNLGTKGDSYEKNGMVPGDLVRYTNANTTASAEWTLQDGSYAYNSFVGENTKKTLDGRTNIYDVDVDGTNLLSSTDYELRANNASVLLANVVAPAAVEVKGTTYAAGSVMAGGDSDTDPYRTFYLKDGAKFIYVTFNDDGDVDSIEFQKGAQNVSNKDLRAFNEQNLAVGKIGYVESIWNNDDDLSDGGPDQVGSNHAEAYFNKDGAIQAVVIKTESGNSNGNNLMYIRDHWGGHTTAQTATGSKGQKLYGYVVEMMNADGKVEQKNIWTNREYDKGDFATYAESTMEGFEPYYTSSKYDRQMRTTSVMQMDVDTDCVRAGTKTLVKVSNVRSIAGEGLLAGYHNEDGTWGLPGAYGTTANILTDLYALSSTMLWNYETITGEKVSFGDIDRTHGGDGLVWLDAPKSNWVDLTGNSIDEAGDLEDFYDVQVSVIINDNPYADGFRRTKMVVVNEANKNSDRPSVNFTVDQETINVEGEDTITMVAKHNLSDAFLAANNLTAHYAWTKDGKSVGTDAPTLTVKKDVANAGTYVCKISFTQTGKADPSSAKAVTFVLSAQTPAPEGVAVTPPETLIKGQANKFVAAPIVGGEVVSGAALKNYSYQWGYYTADPTDSAKQIFVPIEGATDPEVMIDWETIVAADGHAIVCQIAANDISGKPVEDTVTDTVLDVTPEGEVVTDPTTGKPVETPVEDLVVDVEEAVLPEDEAEVKIILDGDALAQVDIKVNGEEITEDKILTVKTTDTITVEVVKWGEVGVVLTSEGMKVSKDSDLKWTTKITGETAHSITITVNDASKPTTINVADPAGKGVTVEANGSAVTNSTEFVVGEDVELTITAPTGKSIASVSFNDKPVNMSNGTYKVTPVAGGNVLVVELEDITLTLADVWEAVKGVGNTNLPATLADKARSLTQDDLVKSGSYKVELGVLSSGDQGIKFSAENLVKHAGVVVVDGELTNADKAWVGISFPMKATDSGDAEWTLTKLGGLKVVANNDLAASDPEACAYVETKNDKVCANIYLDAAAEETLSVVYTKDEESKTFDIPVQYNVTLLEDTIAGLVADAITAATLADTVDASKKVVDSLTVSATDVSSTEIKVTIAATGLVKHNNAANPKVEAYWVGMKLPMAATQAPTGWKLVKLERTLDGEKKEYSGVSTLQDSDNNNVCSAFGPAFTLADDAVENTWTGKLTYQHGDTLSEDAKAISYVIDFTVDLSGVKKAPAADAGNGGDQG